MIFLHISTYMTQQIYVTVNTLVPESLNHLGRIEGSYVL